MLGGNQCLRKAHLRLAAPLTLPLTPRCWQWTAAAQTRRCCLCGIPQMRSPCRTGERPGVPLGVPPTHVVLFPRKGCPALFGHASWTLCSHAATQTLARVYLPPSRFRSEELRASHCHRVLPLHSSEAAVDVVPDLPPLGTALPVVVLRKRGQEARSLPRAGDWVKLKVVGMQLHEVIPAASPLWFGMRRYAQCVASLLCC